MLRDRHAEPHQRRLAGVRVHDDAVERRAVGAHLVGAADAVLDHGVVRGVHEPRAREHPRHAARRSGRAGRAAAT